ELGRVHLVLAGAIDDALAVGGEAVAEHLLARRQQAAQTVRSPTGDRRGKELVGAVGLRVVAVDDPRAVGRDDGELDVGEGEVGDATDVAEALTVRELEASSEGRASGRAARQKDDGESEEPKRAQAGGRAHGWGSPVLIPRTPERPAAGQARTASAIR